VLQSVTFFLFDSVRGINIKLQLFESWILLPLSGLSVRISLELYTISPTTVSLRHFYYICFSYRPFHLPHVYLVPFRLFSFTYTTSDKAESWHFISLVFSCIFKAYQTLDKIISFDCHSSRNLHDMQPSLQ
jgi:hypothetical protein